MPNKQLNAFIGYSTPLPPRLVFNSSPDAVICSTHPRFQLV